MLFQKVMAPLLKSIRNPPDYQEEYTNEYGYLGPALHSAVVKARLAPPAPAQICSSVISATPSIRATAQPGIIASTGSNRTILSGNQNRPVISSTGQQQKYVFVTRPPAPNTVSSTMKAITIR